MSHFEISRGPLTVLATLSILMALVAPKAADSAGRCTRVAKQGGSEFIINNCHTCRVVNIQRKRRGIAMPVMRTFNVRARSKFPVSFKGPGISRITSEVACEGEKGAAQNIIDPRSQQTAQRNCVSVRQSSSGQVVLVNGCNSCRGAAIERFAPGGKSMGRQAYKMKPQSVIPINPKGAVGVSYLADVACKS
ncbi:MAG: hypothetical protein HOL41_13570 [Rhodospirillaceae bacterium]|nr:hypothetical protein [Rhodospirillaceae bacterium]